MLEKDGTFNGVGLRETRIGIHGAVVAQMTFDGSPGADVVKTKGNRIVLVDGKGSGADGDRIPAENLAGQLCALKDSPFAGVYQHLDVSHGFIEHNARCGGYFIYFVAELDGRLRPIPAYFGVDNPNDLSHSMSAGGLHDIRYALMISDGGLELLLHPDVLHTDETSLLKQINRIETMNPKTDFSELQELMVHMLQPFTNVLHAGVDTLKSSYGCYMRTHAKGDNWLTDDATFVLSTIK